VLARKLARIPPVCARLKGEPPCVRTREPFTYEIVSKGETTAEDGGEEEDRESTDDLARLCISSATTLVPCIIPGLIFPPASPPLANTRTSTIVRLPSCSRVRSLVCHSPPVPEFLTAPVQEVGAVNFSTAPSRGHYRSLSANSPRSSLVEEAALSPRGIPVVDVRPRPRFIRQSGLVGEAKLGIPRRACEIV